MRNPVTLYAVEATATHDTVKIRTSVYRSPRRSRDVDVHERTVSIEMIQFLAYADETVFCNQRLFHLARMPQYANSP